MKRIVIILFATLLSQKGMAQNFPDNFVRMGEFPLKHSSAWTPESIFFSDANTGFVIGDSSTQNIKDTAILIYKTTNGGQSWLKTGIRGIFVESKMKMTSSGMLYFTIRDTTSSPCIAGSFRSKLCYSLDNGTTWQIKGLDNMSYIQGSAEVYFLNDQDAILVYKHLNTTCAVTNGVYLTNNQFNTLSYISPIVPANVDMSFGKYRFWHNQKLISISSTGQITEIDKGIKCPLDDIVYLYSSGTDDYYMYDIACPEAEGLDETKYWQGIRRDNLVSNTSSLAFILEDQGSIRRRVFGTSLISEGRYQSDLESFSEIDFAEDSIHHYSPIERDYFGDYDFLEDCSKSHFLTKEIAFVLGYISNVDTKWALYRTMNGQPNLIMDTPIFYGNVAGLENVPEVENEFLVAPNPTNQYLRLQSGSIEMNGEVRLLDALGRLIQSETVKNVLQVEFDMSGLDKDLYYLQYQNQNIDITRKVIKQ